MKASKQRWSFVVSGRLTSGACMPLMRTGRRRLAARSEFPAVRSGAVGKRRLATGKIAMNTNILYGRGEPPKRRRWA
jgi:hypothetical protein